MAKLDGQRVVAGLRGRFAKEVGRQELLQYVADHLRATAFLLAVIALLVHVLLGA